MEKDILHLTGADNVEALGAVMIAIGALGTAAVALVDTTKGLPYIGINAAGFTPIKKEMHLYRAALRKSLGPEWVHVLEGQWLNGRDLGEQKSVAISGVMLGLDPQSARELELYDAIDDGALADAIAALAKGEHEMSDAHTAVLSRFRSVLTMRIDAAYERAQQIYRNRSQLAATAFAIVLALAAQYASMGFTQEKFLTFPGAGVAFLIGLLAVPVAPVAKDIASGLSAAAKALKLGK